MIKKLEDDGFRWAERFAYIILAILLFAWAAISDIDVPTGVLGLGRVDPFFFLGVFWIAIVFSTKAGIAFLQRKSYRGISGVWKGPLTDIKSDNDIGHQSKIIDGISQIAVNELAIYPTGGTSKPSVRGFTGVRFLIFPKYYCVKIGGYVIIMTKMATYPKGTHGNLLPHITEAMTKEKGFRFNHTMIAVGETPDPKWAVEENGEWIVRDAPDQALNVIEEASICRKLNDMMEDGYRSRLKLRAYGYKPEEGEL